MPPTVENENPLNQSTVVSITLTQLSVSITDLNSDLINYTIETKPNIGSQDNSSSPGETGGIKTCSISGLEYNTFYKWYVNATDGTEWTNKTYEFTVEEGMIVDSDFEDSINDTDLRYNSTFHDWYESRNNDKYQLTLDTSNIGGNTGKKAALKGYGNTTYAYLTQELSPTQTNTFNVTLDIYIDKMSEYNDYDRTGFIFLGDDSGGTGGPCSVGSERFVLLVFYDSTPENTTDNNLEIRARENTTGNGHDWANTSTWTTIDTNLSYDTWYTIKLEIDITNNKYDVYVDDILKGDDIAKYEEYNSNSIKHISFSSGGTARGDFYIDNVIG